MKKTLSVLSFIAFGLIVISSCKKPSTATESPAVDPYTYNNELQSSKDISFATLTILDIEMLASFMAENTIFNHYLEAAGTTTGTYTAIRDTMARQLVVAYNNTLCKDGKTRNGSVFLNYQNDPGNPNQNPNARFYHDFGFSAKFVLSDFKVNGWLIQAFDPTKQPFVRNTVSTAAYDPSSVKLTWEFKGKFKLIHPTDNTKDIVWDGSIVKTLTNSTDPLVFPPSKTSPVNWKKSKISYSGTVTGLTSANIPFSYNITSSNPVMRDLNCTFSPAGSSPTVETHPFTNGVATFTTSTFHPRTINYGPSEACDNSGTVGFKEENHAVPFE